MALRQLTLILLVASIAGSFQVGTAFAIKPDNQFAVALADTPDCSVRPGTNVTSPTIILCSITPSDDAYADNLIPSKAFGDLGVLIVQNIPSVPVSKTYAFLKFDTLNNLPAQLAQTEARPANANLRMYVRLMNFFYNATVEVHNASAENWTENTLTWDNMPQFDVNNYVSANIRQNGTWARWNLTSLVQQSFNSSGQVAFAAVSSDTSWRNLVWFDSKEYPFLNGSTDPTLEMVFIEPYLTIETPYPNISISVGSRTIATNANGTAQLLLPWGNYSISVPETIPISNGTRAGFVDWNDQTNSSTRLVSMGNNLTLKANYQLQHELEVYSPFGTATGGGWYFENTDATISVTPTSVPLNGIMGWLGGLHVFDHWSGACNTTTTQCDVLIDSPKSAIAVWRVDWTLTVILVMILAVSTACVAILRRKRSTSTISKRSKRTHRRSHNRRR
ncbi:MAG: DNRLRE domain-containing protein [Candidatus Bathyarchaeia archaeon]